VVHGSNFKYKFCALVFVRIQNKGYKFKLASNVKSLGKFYNVLVEYLDDNCRKSHIFVQLKSKAGKRITMQQLLADRGDFSLRTFYKSYIQIEEKFSCFELGVKMDGSVDDSLFILYTNADVAPDLKSNKATNIGEEKFLMAGGSVLKFNEEEHKDVYDHLKNLPKFRHFLSRFRIFYSQANEKEMDWHIKSELQQSMELSESELDIAYMSFFDFMKEWWLIKNFVLQETNFLDKDTFSKTSELLRIILVADSRTIVLNPRELEAASSC
jgi:hypothetical protein